MVSLKFTIVLAVVLIATLSTVSARMYLLEIDDGQEFQARLHDAPLSRARRSPGKEGVVGPVHTYVKTDKHANFKWGVKHHVGKEYAG
ncbi:Hypothetical predicted protein [Cloeon dipterum]|uniref:Uncharacterized protein n=1 Tax=Cloeon dipterum TaxID=197152 RepID=A0A8S1CQZ3_9INSE|nr:Hypothetical predicted protein [Cloeon dipterum]